MRVRVKSGRTGYYGLQRRREGTEFEIEKPEDFSDKWMEAVDASTPVKAPEKKVDAPAKTPEKKADAPDKTPDKAKDK